MNHVKNILNTGKTWIPLLTFLGGMFWFIGSREIRLLTLEGRAEGLAADMKENKSQIQVLSMLTNDVRYIREDMNELLSMHRRTNLP